jgi:ABC-2 type transport system permease protein
VYPITLSFLCAKQIQTGLDVGGIIGSYISLFFLALVFVAIGIFCSSFSSNSIISFLVSIVLCYVIYWGCEAIGGLKVFEGNGDFFIKQLGIAAHYKSMSRGVLDSRDVLYFFSVIFIFLFGTRTSIYSKKW